MFKSRLILPLLLSMAAHAAAQTAPTLSPATGATNICPDTPIRITFDAPPALGAGIIEIHDASDDSLLDSFPVNPPPAAARGGRGTAVNAPAPVQITPGVSAAESFGKTLPPAGPPMPTRARLVGGTSYTYYPLAIHGNTLTIYPAALLPYNKSIVIKIAEGALQIDGKPSAAIALKFTTKAAAPTLPADGPRKVTIAADGSGDFCTLQAALDFIPQGNTTPTTLFIKNGVYNELINFSGRNNLTILGQDRKKTVLAYADNDAFSNSPPQIPAPPVAAAPAGGRGRGGGGGYRRGSFQARMVSDLTIANLTLHNTTPQGGSQAEAIILTGNANTAHFILTDCDLYSYQDTLQINGQAYISDCYIVGDVDFMWGTGPCFFENCRATSVRPNAYFSQIRNTAANHGYVYKDCTFDGNPGIVGNVFSRIAPAQFPASEVVLLNCVVTSAVGDAGWRFDGGAAAEAGNTHFWEYKSHGPDGKPVDVSKRFAASKQLTDEADAETIKNYSDPKWVLGGQWVPDLGPILKQIKDVTP